MTTYLGVDNTTNIAVSGVWEEDSLISKNQTLVGISADAQIGWSYIGGAWKAPEDTRTYTEKRAEAYPSLTDQADMAYWDRQNGTTTLDDAISAVKTKFPKPV